MKKDEEELKMLSKLEEYKKELKEIVDKLSEGEEERMILEAKMDVLRDNISFLEGARDEGREEGYVQGHEDGREEGREEGRQEGREEGIEIGIERGELRTKKVFQMNYAGKSVEEIAEACGITEEKVRELLAE